MSSYMKLNKLTFSISIIIIGVIVALGVIIVRGDLYFKKTETPLKTEPVITSVALNSITEDDNILGNPNAPVTIIEYSDLGCPFCAEFHETMLQVMQTYGSTGQVNWVYRHFPNTTAHPLSRDASILAECVGQTRGKESFWIFVENIFDLQRTEGTGAVLTDEKINQALGSVGMDGASRELCISYGNLSAKVDLDYQDGLKIAEKNPDEFGTPYIIMISAKGTTVEQSSTLPYDLMKQYIDLLLLDK